MGSMYAVLNTSQTRTAVNFDNCVRGFPQLAENKSHKKMKTVRGAHKKVNDVNKPVRLIMPLPLLRHMYVCMYVFHTYKRKVQKTLYE